MNLYNGMAAAVQMVMAIDKTRPSRVSDFMMPFALCC